MSTKDVIQSYYDSLTKKDDKWQELYADDSFFLMLRKLYVQREKLRLFNYSSRS